MSLVGWTFLSVGMFAVGGVVGFVWGARAGALVARRQIAEKLDRLMASGEAIILVRKHLDPNGEFSMPASLFFSNEVKGKAH